jgi:isopenicillin N synthase-like dioxygenase
MNQIRPDAGLPVLDMRQLDGEAAERAAFGRALRAACVETGFFYIAHHGIPEAMIERVLAEARDFFALDAAEKLRVDLRQTRHNRGYEPLRAQTLEAGTPPDLKEGYYIGQDLPQTDPRVIAGRFNHGPNLWPEGRAGFRAAMEEYCSAMVDLSARLMHGLALSLELEWNYFDRFCHDPLYILRLLHYPPQPANPEPGEKGCGAHTDWGTLTLLWQDQVGGLQVRDRAGRWLDAPPVAGSFVVNIGDMVARWTNDLYTSNLHRVINRSGRDRYSIPFFFEGNAEYPIECLPTCQGADNPPRYAPVSVTDHLLEMYRRTYA